MTAEFAVALPAVIALVAVLVGSALAGVSQIRAEEAARAAARGMARGEPPAEVAREVSRVAGADAVHHVSSSGTLVTVTVTVPVPGAWGSAAGLRAIAAATLSHEGTP
ncbi:TadE family type IV pilus minor pilin [Sinomonas halotolerans]|uniref:TadE family type IV pilus minor pilin n=1 Tax=Sinomonas halotolerans TaxID=1644133 RepID=A0ABU9X1I4_9MICC